MAFVLSREETGVHPVGIHLIALILRFPDAVAEDVLVLRSVSGRRAGLVLANGDTVDPV
jgi:hypothetical protein